MIEFIQQNPHILILIPVFLFSLSVHEFAHALAANWAGDMLSTYKGRLTLNPIVHIDLFGTIIIPAVLLISSGGSAFFGWAKPVPVNPLAYKKSWYEIVVSGAGPASNALLVIVFWIVLVILQALGVMRFDERDVIGMLVFWFIHLNVLLMFFNLIPIPPLDGSHILMHLIYHEPWGKPVIEFLQRFGFILFIIFLVTPLSGIFFRFVWSVTLFLIRSAGAISGNPA
jgi:Zn-dependent protease